MSPPTTASRVKGSDFRSTHQEFSPILMAEIEITLPLPTFKCSNGYERAWVLVRMGTEPVGTCVIQLQNQGLSPDHLGELIWAELHQSVVDRFVAAGLPPPTALTGRGLQSLPDSWPFLRSRRQTLAAAPFISVVICTRNRSQQIENCLRSLELQQYPNFEIIVVDNSQGMNSLRNRIAARKTSVKCRYVMEPKVGLSRARNTGVKASSGDIVAFLDDDEEPDKFWLAELARGFARGTNIGCVSGMIVPMRLETRAQERFEELGGHSKGRGFSSSVFSKQGPQSPLFPRPPFGAGGNMAFRREALAKIGGFDVALGVGTPARAGEDTLALTLTLLNEYCIAYEPSAFVRHDHYELEKDLCRQLRGYGVGITAFYTALIRHQPSTIPALVRLGFQATAYLRGSQADESMRRYKLPRSLRLQHRLGLVTGPPAYIRSVCGQLRISREGKDR